MTKRLIHGDCREVVTRLAKNSIDAIVTDPPYGLGFMGKGWDHAVPGPEYWREFIRVAKPGAHLIAFGGSRTFHRMACAIEDAGWEYRDTIMWLYGSGFPKSHDVSKAIDKAAGAKRDVIGKGKGRTGKAAQPNGGSTFSDDTYQWPGEYEVTAPATDAAKQWSGWGTALKPAFEPIVLARKPLDGTVAANVLEHGVGGINIDDCRVPAESRPLVVSDRRSGNNTYGDGLCGSRNAGSTTEGRWPANVIHDGSDEVMEEFAKYGERKAGGAVKGGKHYANAGYKHGIAGERSEFQSFADTGTVARFFYCAKASKKERGEGNDHPTVKPIALMEYLCKLVTPPGGTILDPFMGSGTTGVAAANLGHRFIGIEQDQHNVEIARRRNETGHRPETIQALGV